MWLYGTIYNEDLDESTISYINKSKSVYERNKNVYIKEVYDNLESMNVLWSVYTRNILPFEKSLNKDLYQFNVSELGDLLKSVPSTSINVKEQVFSFCSQYLIWAIDKKLIRINNLAVFNREEITAISNKLASSKYISMERMWQLANEFSMKNDKQEILPMVLGRYGVVGEDFDMMLNLRLEDIEDNIINVYNQDEELVTIIPSDIRLKRYCEMAINEDNSVYKGDKLLKQDWSKNRNELDWSGIYRRIKKVYKDNNCKNISFNNLLLSRKIDLILEVREERKVNTNDLLDIIKIFNPKATNGSYSSLKRYYEGLTGDKVMSSVKKKGYTLEDKNSKETVREIRKRLEKL